MASKTIKTSGRKERIGNDSRNSSELTDATPAEKPVSLHPLEFEEAVEGLFKVKPDRGKLSQGRK